MVLSLVGEDNVNLLGGVAANVRSEHDGVLRVTSPLGVIDAMRERETEIHA